MRVPKTLVPEIPNQADLCKSFKVGASGVCDVQDKAYLKSKYKEVVAKLISFANDFYVESLNESAGILRVEEESDSDTVDVSFLKGKSKEARKIAKLARSYSKLIKHIFRGTVLDSSKNQSFMRKVNIKTDLLKNLQNKILKKNGVTIETGAASRRNLVSPEPQIGVLLTMNEQDYENTVDEIGDYLDSNEAANAQIQTVLEKKTKAYLKKKTKLTKQDQVCDIAYDNDGDQKSSCYKNIGALKSCVKNDSTDAAIKTCVIAKIGKFILKDQKREDREEQKKLKEENNQIAKEKKVLDDDKSEKKKKEEEEREEKKKELTETITETVQDALDGVGLGDLADKLDDLDVSDIDNDISDVNKDIEKRSSEIADLQKEIEDKRKEAEAETDQKKKNSLLQDIKDLEKRKEDSDNKLKELNDKKEELGFKLEELTGNGLRVLQDTTSFDISGIQNALETAIDDNSEAFDAVGSALEDFSVGDFSSTLDDIQSAVSDLSSLVDTSDINSALDEFQSDISDISDIASIDLSDVNDLQSDLQNELSDLNDLSDLDSSALEAAQNALNDEDGSEAEESERKASEVDDTADSSALEAAQNALNDEDGSEAEESERKASEVDDYSSILYENFGTASEATTLDNAIGGLYDSLIDDTKQAHSDTVGDLLSYFEIAGMINSRYRAGLKCLFTSSSVKQRVNQAKNKSCTGIDFWYFRIQKSGITSSDGNNSSTAVIIDQTKDVKDFDIAYICSKGVKIGLTNYSNDDVNEVAVKIWGTQTFDYYVKSLKIKADCIKDIEKDRLVTDADKDRCDFVSDLPSDIADIIKKASDKYKTQIDTCFENRNQKLEYMIDHFPILAYIPIEDADFEYIMRCLLNSENCNMIDSVSTARFLATLNFYSNDVPQSSFVIEDEPESSFVVGGATPNSDATIDSTVSATLTAQAIEEIKEEESSSSLLRMSMMLIGLMLML
eukprot:CAMPEP_0170536290 /NCGR_PEP_ID=MMETSP0209-20121228/102066_1 /TAXON_ID=665100 ORGANISM="Litonotus pictus, Strain P1" /NCGR_SAMPLE_ID=MMETSP0209 /ASSEMBLY_ACC=CAM_ASM_000301 /LENGTH=957 /DNA_ID=CAMNT_0010837639 /DNA_START=104 /DNA_END=2979 /DNA_ORIENTATION=+